MEELLTAAQMRATEEAAMASGRVSGLELMERAGEEVVAAIRARWPELVARGGPAVVLCGPGNNGGDGFVIARLLSALGVAVEVHLVGKAGALPPDARANHDRWAAQGPVRGLPFTAAPARGAREALVIDALFGTGLARALGPDLATVLAAFEAAQDTTWHRVAVDIPSGLCADSGRVMEYAEGRGAVFRADLTVSFHRAKCGHVLARGPALCGTLKVAPIGLDEIGVKDAASPGDAPTVSLLTTADPFRDRLRKSVGHKYAHGHVLVVSGAAGHTGAARLAARGALRVGAGLVTLATPHEALAECAAQLTAIMLAEAGEARALARLLEDPRLNALALGPGLGIERARDLVPVALEAGRPVVLDADALSAFSPDPDALFDRLHPACVLTPHGGEFARLFPDLARDIEAPAVSGPATSKIDVTRAAARRAGCTVLFKGSDTVIADPDGRVTVHAAAYGRAAPWLATAGTGDVLTGLIAGLLARGFAPGDAAACAAWLHTEAARRVGPGLIAEDLPEALPGVFRALDL